jgi:N-methylhydantoinase B
MINTMKRDSIVVEIVRSYLSAATREMAWAFDRTAYDPVITEIRDYGLALFDKDIRIIAESVGVPPFSGTLGMGIRTGIEAIGKDNLEEGDVFWNNWPYWNSSQVNDVTLAAPIFYQGEIVGYSGAKAHLIDIGQKDPAYCIDTLDVYQEGLKLPGVKLIKKGKVDGEIERIIKFNSRTPDRNIGNVYAQVSAVQTGVKRYLSLIEKYGLETFEYCVNQIIAHGEKISRQALKELPKGSWEAEDFLDNNVISEVPIKMKVQVSITEDCFLVDYTGSDEQVEGTVNCPLGISISAANSTFKSITTPNEPTNAGHFAPVKVIAPEGTIFNPTPPAGVFLIWPGGHAYDLIRKALIQGLPERIPACSTGDCYSLMISGGFSKKYDYKHFYIFANDHGGGLGAYYGHDGESVVVHDSLAGGQNTPTEVNETFAPVLVQKWALVPDSGGPGMFRGGLGMVEEVKVLSKSRATTILLRRKSPPWGFNGGRSAKPGRNIFFPDSAKELIVSTKALDMEKGEVVRVVSAGGGGWGDPLRRDPELVARDVEFGYVTRTGARNDYGVCVRHDFSVDLRATRALRAKLARKRKRDKCKRSK